MATFLVTLIAAFVCALAVLNVHASRRCWRDGLSSRGQRIAQIAFVWLVPGLGAALALHLLRAEPERGSGTYSAEEDDDADDLSDFEAADGGGYTHAPHHDAHSGGGDVSSH